MFTNSSAHLEPYFTCTNNLKFTKLSFYKKQKTNLLNFIIASLFSPVPCQTNLLNFRSCFIYSPLSHPVHQIHTWCPSLIKFFNLPKTKPQVDRSISGQKLEWLDAFIQAVLVYSKFLPLFKVTIHGTVILKTNVRKGKEIEMVFRFH